MTRAPPSSSILLNEVGKCEESRVNALMQIRDAPSHQPPRVTGQLQSACMYTLSITLAFEYEKFSRRPKGLG